MTKPNFTYLKSLIGILKLVTIIVGLIALSLGLIDDFSAETPNMDKKKDFLAYKVDCSKENQILDLLFIVFVALCLIISIVNIIACIFIQMNKKLTLVDILFHALGGLFLLIGSSTILGFVTIIYDCVSNKAECNNLKGSAQKACTEDAAKAVKFSEGVAAGAVGLINTIIYIVLAFLLWRSLKPSEPVVEAKVEAPEEPIPIPEPPPAEPVVEPVKKEKVEEVPPPPPPPKKKGPDQRSMLNYIVDAK